MTAALQLHRDRKERTSEFRRRFAERLQEATAAFNKTRGRALTYREFAGLLQEATGKPVTARSVSRWYRGLSEPRYEFSKPVAALFGVCPKWLFYGETPIARGVYRLKRGFGFDMIDDRGGLVATFRFTDSYAPRDAESEQDRNVTDRLWEILGYLDGEHPPELRIADGGCLPTNDGVQPPSLGIVR